MPSDEIVGRSVTDFCKAVGISRATYFALVPEHLPHARKIGKVIKVYESPADWYARLPEGGAKTKPRKRR